MRRQSQLIITTLLTLLLFSLARPATELDLHDGKVWLHSFMIASTLGCASDFTGTPSANTVLKGNCAWTTLSGTGDVVGPAASVDAELPLFDSTSGKLLKRASGSGLVHATSGVASFGDADIGDDTNLAAGRSLTLSGDSVEADAELFTRTKCINVDPAATTTDWLMFRAESAITVTGIDCIVDAATSVVMTPQECDGNGANCVDIEAAITCAATNTTEATSVDNSSVDAGDWVRVTRGLKTGSPTQANLCVTYTVND